VLIEEQPDQACDEKGGDDGGGDGGFLKAGERVLRLFFPGDAFVAQQDEVQAGHGEHRAEDDAFESDVDGGLVFEDLIHGPDCEEGECGESACEDGELYKERRLICGLHGLPFYVGRRANATFVAGDRRKRV